jgi:hypothetical protein
MFDVGVGVCIFGSLGLRQRGGTRRRYAFLRGRGRARGSRSRWWGGGGLRTSGFALETVLAVRVSP